MHPPGQIGDRGLHRKRLRLGRTITRSRARRGLAFGGLIATAAVLTEGPPREVDIATSEKKTDYWRRRFEPAGFPIIAGSSDTGFQFGLVTTLSYFANGVKPYAWNMDLLATLSIKGRDSGGGTGMGMGRGGGLEFAQEALQWNIDWPGLFGGNVRLNPQTSYTRTINVGWFGLGNASSPEEPNMGMGNSSNNKGRFHEFIEDVLYERVLARIDVSRPYGILASMMARYVQPSNYVQSKLAIDEQSMAPGGGPILYGTRNLTMLSGGIGAFYDSRDNEIYTHTGMFHQVGIRFEEGVPWNDNVRYLEVGGIFAGFLRLGPSSVLAMRFLADAQIGHVPFFDLIVAGPFQLKEAPGGSSGVRGVPVGRYAGPVKVLGNIEFRSLPWKFSVFKQQIRLGGDLFADTGRLWSTPTFKPLDGSGIGLKWGAGAGGYILWGQAAIFRIEVAYSPDATSTGSLPVGIYVEDGTMF
jgi:hypothetical protein